MNSNSDIIYKYNGAKSLVMLHEKYINKFYETWLKAKKLSITLPETDDKDYESLNTLLRHVLRSSRGYIVWICEKLNLPDPEIKNAPEPDRIEQLAKAYIEHLLDRWKIPLNEVEEKKFIDDSFISNWGTHYCIDAMLEHAVMHPIRHEFQLQKLIKIFEDAIG